MQKFFTEHNNPIVACIIDNHDICQSGWAKEISINLSDFLVHRFIARGYNVFIGKDEDELLNSASDSGYTHAVMIASGTSTKLSDRLFSAIRKLCEKDFFIAGHILDREDSYYELHQQFYVVNLQEYRNCDRPSVGLAKDVPHEKIEPIRSVEGVKGHIDIPVWVKQGTTLKAYSKKMHGWNIIDVALQQDKLLIDLGEEIRDNKFYLYYEYDHVFLRQLRQITYNHFFCNNFFAGWNSDHLRDNINYQGPIDQYITVGIGFNWIKNLQMLGTTSNTKVIFTDINHQCLMFMKKMVEEWDGKDYAEFYKANFPMLPNNAPNPDGYFIAVEQEWNKFRDSFEDWDNMWEHVKTLAYDYVLIDYMADYNLDWIQPGVKTIINLSDVFTHVPFIAMLSLKFRVSCENNLINSLRKVDPNIVLMVTSRAADSFHKQQQRIRFAPVGEYDITDIHDLNKPLWHEQDWTSPRPLG